MVLSVDDFSKKANDVTLKVNGTNNLMIRNTADKKITILDATGKEFTYYDGILTEGKGASLGAAYASNNFSATSDIKDVEKLINKRTKALILLHKDGDVVDLDKYVDLCKSYNIKLIEDRR